MNGLEFKREKSFQYYISYCYYYQLLFLLIGQFYASLPVYIFFNHASASYRAKVILWSRVLQLDFFIEHNIKIKYA